MPGSYSFFVPDSYCPLSSIREQLRLNITILLDQEEDISYDEVPLVNAIVAADYALYEAQHACSACSASCNG